MPLRSFSNLFLGIPIGVTNVSELCMWMESSNKVYGRTNNPYHVGRTCGGSSGGEAAILAAGGSPMGIGSDVGGSSMEYLATNLLLQLFLTRVKFLWLMV